jgi:urease accessory protein
VSQQKSFRSRNATFCFESRFRRMISKLQPTEAGVQRHASRASKHNLTTLRSADLGAMDHRRPVCSSASAGSRHDAPPQDDDNSLSDGMASDWLVWQLADSAFPTGGFAHSGGLEAAWQQGEIQSSNALAEFIAVHLAQTGRAALPFLNEAFHETQPFATLDRLAEAFLSNHVANRGSRAQGQAFLFGAAHAFPSPALTAFRRKLLGEKLPGHFAPVFGVVVRAVGISHALGVRLYLFLALRSLLGSAVRLGIVGPMAAQALQSSLAGDAEQIGLRCASLRVADAAQISPVLDVLHGAHDRLYSRLFQT